MATSECLCCSHGVSFDRPRICPMCGHQFRGNGWDGIDAHWRSKHENDLPYEQFRDTLCARHRA